MFKPQILTILLALASPCLAQSVASVDVGDQRIDIEVPEGYVRVSERSSDLMAFGQSLLPATNRLVETLLSEEDLARQLKGQSIVGFSYQVQTLRALETTPVSEAEWQQARPMMVAQMGLVDTDDIAKKAVVQANDALEKSQHRDASVQITDPLKPQMYGSDPKSIRFSMMLGMEVEKEGKKAQANVEIAGAITVVSQRLVYLYAYKVDPQDGADSTQALRSALDAFISRVQALNP